MQELSPSRPVIIAVGHTGRYCREQATGPYLRDALLWVTRSDQSGRLEPCPTRRNITGIILTPPNRRKEPKRVQHLPRSSPGLTRLASLGDFRNPAIALQWEQVQTAAQSLELSLWGLTCEAQRT